LSIYHAIALKTLLLEIVEQILGLLDGQARLLKLLVVGLSIGVYF